VAVNLEAELQKAHARIRELTAPPTLEIVRHVLESDPYPASIQMTFEWQGYRHRSIMSSHYESNIDYREHMFRQGVEACVRAHAEAQLSSLVTTDETFVEHWLRMRRGR
jgi:hypothetical protein